MSNLETTTSQNTKVQKKTKNKMKPEKIISIQTKGKTVKKQT